MKDVYQLSIDKTFRQFDTGEAGLTADAVLALRQQHGENSITEARQRSRWSILLSQFDDVMIIILMVAAGISFFAGEPTDGFVILAIVLLNAWMGYTQEYNAEQSIRLLRKMAAQHALVVRDHTPQKIEAQELVPGDLIHLEAGDIVPADVRLIEISAFRTDEASLTGESYAVDKTTHALQGHHLVPGDQHNMAFKSTLVTNGTARAIVTAIGMKTEIGKIAGLLTGGDTKTPLQMRLSKFSKQLAVIVVIICLIVFGFGLWRGEPWMQMFLTALSLAVAALPEALPAVITIALAQGAHRMVRQKALIRRLPAVETLGSVTYICSDKTGTLTQNVMTVEKVFVVDQQDDLMRHAMILNHEVRFADANTLLGDATETAMVRYALEAGLSKEAAEHRFPIEGKIPFDSFRMRMSTLHQHHDHWILLVKGAPVKIMETLDPRFEGKKEEWIRQNREWAKEGLRVLFFAYKVMHEKPAILQPDTETDLSFLGMVAMIDPPREEVIEAIVQCHTAGIHTVMITGDQALTARAIAERLNIIPEGSERVMTGAELEALPEDVFKAQVKDIAVYARVSPEQKLKIVEALQEHGEFVAMTGDGVNDAPSLKQADIGLAMGITGTDVSKEASDMILLDDNFATIVKAIKAGRRIYSNIRKFIVYVLSCNLAEILTLFAAPLLGMAIPLLPIHILWINLVTDGLPGIALVAEPAEKDIMNRPPRSPKENLFSGGLIPRILMTAIILTLSCLFIQWWAIDQGYDVRMQQTLVFTTLCFVQLGNALSIRSDSRPILSAGIFANRGMWGAIIMIILLQTLIVFVPAVHPFFKTTALPPDAFWMVLWVTLASTLLIEVFKFFNRHRYHS